MFFSSHDKKIRQQRANPLQDKLVKSIAETILKAQCCFATFLDRRINQLSVAKRKILFIIFCVFTSGLSFYHIVTAIAGTDKNAIIIKSTKIKLPKYYNQTGEAKTDLLISQYEYESVQVFKTYMDSLQKNYNGKFIYDSILHARPGLMDSVRMLEYLYQLQNQKH